MWWASSPTPPTIYLLQTIAVLFQGNGSIPQEPFKWRFQGSFFYSFFPFETPFFFLPWRGKKEKKQLGKQSPSAEPWLLACRCCCDFGKAGWGPVTKKWRETERSLTPRALCPCPYTPVSVSLSLCSLSPFLSPFSRPSSSPTPIPWSLVPVLLELGACPVPAPGSLLPWGPRAPCFHSPPIFALLLNSLCLLLPATGYTILLPRRPEWFKQGKAHNTDAINFTAHFISGWGWGAVAGALGTFAPAPLPWSQTPT